MDRKRSLVIGPRTHEDILRGRNIRKHEDGGDVFEDYWTDSDEESSVCSKRSDCSSKLREKALSANSLNTIEPVNEEEVTVNLGNCDGNLSPSKQKSPVSSLQSTETFENKTENPGTTKKVLRSTDVSPLSKTFDKKKERLDASKTALKTIDVSSSEKKTGKEREMPVTPKKNLRSTYISSSPKTSGKRKMPLTPTRNLRSTFVSSSPKTSGKSKEMPLTPKRILRSTDVSSSPKAYGKKRNMPGTPEKNSRSIDASPLSKTFDKNTDIPETLRSLKSAANNLIQNDIHVLSKTKKLDYVMPNESELEDAVATVLAKTFNKKEMPTTPKRNLRSTSRDTDMMSEIKELTSDAADMSNILKLQDNNSPLSKTHNIKKTSLLPRRISEIRSQNSKKSSTFIKSKKAAEIEEILSHYDEYDAKIMQMIHRNDDDDHDESFPNSQGFGNKKSPTQEPSVIEKKQTRSHTSKQTLKASKNFHEGNISGENEPESVNISRDNRIITRSVNKNNDLESSLEKCIPDKENFEFLIDPGNVDDNAPHVSPHKPCFVKNQGASNSVENVNKSSRNICEKTNQNITKNASNYESAGLKHNEKISGNESNDIDSNQSSQISSDKSVISEKYIASNKSKGKNPKEKKMFSQSSLVNTSMHSSKRSVEDIAEISEVDNIFSLETNEKRKTIANKRIRSIQNESDCDDHSLKSPDASEESALSEMSEDHSLVKNQKRKDSKTVKSKNRCNSSDHVHMPNQQQLGGDSMRNSSENIREKVNKNMPKEVSMLKSTAKKHKAKIIENDRNCQIDDFSLSKTAERKRIVSKRNKSVQDENDNDNCHLLKAKDVPRESCSSGMSKDNLSVHNEKRKRRKRSVRLKHQFNSTDRIHRQSRRKSVKEDNENSSNDTLKTNENMIKNNANFKSSSKKKKAKPIERHNSDSVDNQMTSYCVVPNKIVTLNGIEAAAAEDDIEISPELFQVNNTSANSSKHSIEDDAEIGDADTCVSKTAKKQKTVAYKRNGTIQNENKHDEAHSLKTADVHEESATSGMSEDDLSVLKQKRKKKKFVKSQNGLDNEDHVRRSNRQRYAPFARWLNQRLLYRFEKGEIKVLGIDEGVKSDNFIEQRMNKRKYLTEKKKLNKTKPKKARLQDPVENKKLCIELHKKFSLAAWDTPVSAATDKNSQHSYLIKRMIETQKNAFGFLQIEGGKEKPPQYMPEEDLQLTVMRGKLQIEVQKNVYTLFEKDMFIVPKRCAYNIKNIGKQKALLSFVVGRFKFMDSE